MGNDYANVVYIRIQIIAEATMRGNGRMGGALEGVPVSESW